jgi:hypothetical protein
MTLATRVKGLERRKHLDWLTMQMCAIYRKQIRSTRARPMPQGKAEDVKTGTLLLLIRPAYSICMHSIDTMHASWECSEHSLHMRPAFPEGTEQEQAAATCKLAGTGSRHSITSSSENEPLGTPHPHNLIQHWGTPSPRGGSQKLLVHRRAVDMKGDSDGAGGTGR